MNFLNLKNTEFVTEYSFSKIFVTKWRKFATEKSQIFFEGKNRGVLYLISVIREAHLTLIPVDCKHGNCIYCSLLLRVSHQPQAAAPLLSLSFSLSPSFPLAISPQLYPKSFLSFVAILQSNNPLSFIPVAIVMISNGGSIIRVVSVISFFRFCC
jgi:hypothetical protein